MRHRWPLRHRLLLCRSRRWARLWRLTWREPTSTMSSWRRSIWSSKSANGTWLTWWAPMRRLSRRKTLMWVWNHLINVTLLRRFNNFRKLLRTYSPLAYSISVHDPPCDPLMKCFPHERQPSSMRRGDPSTPCSTQAKPTSSSCCTWVVAVFLLGNYLILFICLGRTL